MGGGTPPPPTVYGHSNTSLPLPVPTDGRHVLIRPLPMAPQRAQAHTRCSYRTQVSQTALPHRLRRRKRLQPRVSHKDVPLGSATLHMVRQRRLHGKSKGKRVAWARFEAEGDHRVLRGGPQPPVPQRSRGKGPVQRGQAAAKDWPGTGRGRFLLSCGRDQGQALPSGTSSGAASLVRPMPLPGAGGLRVPAKCTGQPGRPSQGQPWGGPFIWALPWATPFQAALCRDLCQGSCG